MSNKIFFNKKQKMFTAYGFHIDFQFRGQKSLPRDLWMAQTPKCTFSEPVSSRMQFLDFFFFSTIFYVYWHMLGCVELKKLQVGAFGNSLLQNDVANKLEVRGVVSLACTGSPKDLKSPVISSGVLLFKNRIKIKSKRP